MLKYPQIAMDNSEELGLCRFGTPLEPLEEEDVPTKKPITIEDQIVTDENGRRRFHGAFTGGFSAGFWNTVGSLEGWKPQSFKSSRGEKAEKRKLQMPTDFMDEEDLGEFGIAPQRVQAREGFAKADESNSRKRKFLNTDCGPIPGIPVLQQLLEPSRKKVAVNLLGLMGWRPGQGIGARQTRREKTRSGERNNRELYVMKMYGCEVESKDKSSTCPTEKISGPLEEEEEEDEEITFAPDDFDPFLCCVKDNTFGLGYSGLSRNLISDTVSNVNLFGSLEVMGKSNKKLSIRGQAFGVGALEEEDEDIYAYDDMSKYDFSLGEKKNRNKAKITGVQDQTMLEGFVESSDNSNVGKTVYRIELKSSFQPRNWLQRKTRFEPLSNEEIMLPNPSDIYKKRALGRHDLNPKERGNILEGKIEKKNETKINVVDSRKKSYLQHISEKYKEREDKSKQILELLSANTHNFVKGGLITNLHVEIPPSEVEVSEAVKSENQQILVEAKEITKSLGSFPATFRPFINDMPKQERYEKFIQANLKEVEEIKEFLTKIQPIHLSQWHREMEVKEFIQAQNIYKPLNGLMSQRFVSKSIINDLNEISRGQHDEKVNVSVERTKKLWKPCALICKRFNIPEPFGGTLIEQTTAKKNKFSVFDYIENSVNSKKDFITPIIIPKHVEKPKEIQIQKYSLENSKEILDKDSLSLGKDIVSTKSLSNENISEIKTTQTHQTFNRDTKKTKTELELRIEESRSKHFSEKKDLFKCIFDDSSGDETLTENENFDHNPKNTEFTVPTEIVKTLVKPSAPINILRNNSPPRGIFAALLLNSSSQEEKNDTKTEVIVNLDTIIPKPKHKEEKEEETKQTSTEETSNVDKIIFKPKHQRHLEEKFSESNGVYGPKIPPTFAPKTSMTSKDEKIDKDIIDILSTKLAKSTKVIEKWVEKTAQVPKQKKKKKEKKKEEEKLKKNHKKSKNNKKREK